MTTHTALSIQQPWAWLIVNGYKDVENRHWKFTPKYRGKLLIHAGKEMDKIGYDHAREIFETLPISKTVAYPDYMSAEFQLGGIVGEVEMVDVVTKSDSPWFFGPMAFVFRNAKPLKSIAYKGQLGFFKVELP